jgi:hypothetical protein
MHCVSFTHHHRTGEMGKMTSQAETTAAVTDIPYLANKVAEFEAAPPRSLRRDFLLSALMGDMQDLGIEPTPELLEEAGIARRDVAGHWDAACSMLRKHRNTTGEGRTDA